MAEVAKRDGPDCWLCSLPFNERATKPGRRRSLEHHLARTLGGTDDLANLRLCHDSCNRHLGERPPEQKLRMREKWHRETARRTGRAPFSALSL